MLGCCSMTCKYIYPYYCLCIKLPVHMHLEVIGQDISIWGTQNYLFPILCVNTNNLRYVSSKSKHFLDFDPLYKLGLTLDIISDSKNKHRRCKKTIHFGISYSKTNNLTLFSEKFLTHVELSRSTAAILQMPQYVAYQKNVAIALLTFSTRFYTFNSNRTKMQISCALLL